MSLFNCICIGADLKNPRPTKTLAHESITKTSLIMRICNVSWVPEIPSKLNQLGLKPLIHCGSQG